MVNWAIYRKIIMSISAGIKNVFIIIVATALQVVVSLKLFFAYFI